MTSSRLRIVGLYPELLGTYGDGGNLLVLEQRLRWRGVACEVTRVRLQDAVPVQGDLFVLGGGEDQAQVAALGQLRSSPLVTAVERGAHVFGVCAGLQILGNSFAGPDGHRHEGLGLLDVETDRMLARAVGEVVVRPTPGLGLPLITGFENHRGMTALGAAASPLGDVVVGTGNGAPAAPPVEGVVQGRVVATYLHGPVLARNPALADLLLERVLGQDLQPCPIKAQDELYAERLQQATS
ncbi:MAG: glutamine amidotransferase [Frankiales bacterium]|nr:glutamine amidotransferase [Frankiales bacterium]